MTSQADFSQRYGPWGLVAGASEGLGLAYAEAMAQRGLNLVLVARRAAVLNDAATAIEDRYGVEVVSLVQDLTDSDAAYQARDAVGDRDLGLVVYNAAYSLIGPFLQHSVEQRLKELEVNCRGPLAFSHIFGKRLTERGRGGLILLSSLAGMQGSPWISHYAATKAYNLILGEGLAEEFGQQGVDVQVCCAGATRTPNYERSRPATARAPVQEPRVVAEESLAALGRRRVVVPGRLNRLAALFMTRVLTRRRATRIMATNLRKIYGESLPER